jgi:hypothetical protein
LPVRADVRFPRCDEKIHSSLFFEVLIEWRKNAIRFARVPLYQAPDFLAASSSQWRFTIKKYKKAGRPSRAISRARGCNAFEVEDSSRTG